MCWTTSFFLWNMIYVDSKESNTIFWKYPDARQEKRELFWNKKAVICVCSPFIIRYHWCEFPFLQNLCQKLKVLQFFLTYSFWLKNCVSLIEYFYCNLIKNYFRETFFVFLYGHRWYGGYLLDGLYNTK